MNKGETMQAYFMRISQLKDQLLTVGEIVSDRELMLIALGGLPMIWETFVTTVSNNDRFPSFDELLGKCIQEESRMISRGRIQKHEDGEPTAFSAQAKKKKEKGRPSNWKSIKQGQGSKNNNQGFKNNNIGFKKDMSNIKCYNCYKHGLYA